MKPIFTERKRRKQDAFVIVFEKNGARERDVLATRELRLWYEQSMSLRTRYICKLLYRINVVPK